MSTKGSTNNEHAYQVAAIIADREQSFKPGGSNGHFRSFLWRYQPVTDEQANRPESI